MIRLAIDRPVGVMVGISLVLLFGMLSISDLPIQLTPDVSGPFDHGHDRLAGAAPAEVEKEVLLPQEEVLEVGGRARSMVGEASDGTSTLTLEFEVGTSMEEALVRASNRLAQVDDYPDAAREPVLATADTSGPPLAVLTITGRGERTPIAARTWVLEEVVPRFERIRRGGLDPGVWRPRHRGAGPIRPRVACQPGHHRGRTGGRCADGAL